MGKERLIMGKSVRNHKHYLDDEIELVKPKHQDREKWRKPQKDPFRDHEKPVEDRYERKRR